MSRLGGKGVGEEYRNSPNEEMRVLKILKKKYSSSFVLNLLYQI